MSDASDIIDIRGAGAKPRKRRDYVPRQRARIEQAAQNNRPDGWSVSEVATLRELWGQVRATAIAALLGRTRNAVIGKAYRLGLDTIPHDQICAWTGVGLRAYHHSARCERQALWLHNPTTRRGR